MISAIVPDGEPDDAWLRETLRLAPTPRSDSLGSADGPGTTGWGITTTANCSGANAHTLHYYERIGPVRVDRDALGHRHYDAATVRRLVLLARMRTLGMPVRGLRRHVELIEADRDTVPGRLTLPAEYRKGPRVWTDEPWLALAATEYKIAGYMRKLEGQAVPGSINTPSTNISSANRGIPS